MLMLLVLLLLAGDGGAQLQHNALSYFGREGVWGVAVSKNVYPLSFKFKNKCEKPMP